VSQSLKLLGFGSNPKWFTKNNMIEIIEYLRRKKGSII
jgi:hypothetical protein